MSLLTKASLVATPTAYGDGVLNSVKPTNGDGDFDFARASSATRVNEQGLIEKERENLLLQSNQFDTTWSATNANLTSGQSGYDGSSDAWRVEATTTGTTRVLQTTSIAANTLITMSLYAKVGNVDFIKFNLVTSGTNSIVTFDLTDGSVYNSNAIDENWQSIGNGWVRISATFVNSDAITQARFEVRSKYNTSSCDAGSFIYIQDAQLEQGLVATDYIETTTTSVAVGITNDIPRINYENGIGNFLLEPQRTNLFTDSEYFNGSDWILQDATITNNAAISPEGVQNASLYTTTSDLYDFVRQNISFVSGTTYTYSVFAKQGTSSLITLSYNSAAFGTSQSVEFDLSDGTYTINSGSPSVKMEDYGNGWYRCAITATATASVTRTTGFSSTAAGAVTTLYLYGAQFEESSYVTSYIPTYGASVTRVAETCNNAGDSSLFNDSEGVLYAEIQNEDVSNYKLISISDGTDNNRVFLGTRLTTGYIYYFVISGGSTQASYITTQLASDFTKVAVKYKANDFALWINGTEVSTDSSGSTPIGLDSLQFNGGSGTLDFQGKTKMVSTFTEALSDSELECLTSWSSFNRMATAQNYTIE